MYIEMRVNEIGMKRKQPTKAIKKAMFYEEKNKMIKEYMINTYVFLIKAGRRTIDTIPEPCKIPVAEALAKQEEKQ